jgi:hypothetical protein
MLKPSLCKKLTGREISLMVLENVDDTLNKRTQSFSSEEINIALYRLSSRETTDYRSWMSAINLIEKCHTHARVALYKQSFLISLVTQIIEIDTKQTMAKLPALTAKAKSALKFYLEMQAITEKFMKITGKDCYQLPELESSMEAVLGLYHYALASHASISKELTDNRIELDALKPSAEWLEKLEAAFEGFPGGGWSKIIC